MSDEPTERERLCICPPFHPAGMPDDTHTRECSRHWVLLAERIAEARREGAAETVARVEAVLEATEWDDWPGRHRLIPRLRAALRGDA